MTKYRLGLDLGTASIGSAAYELDEQNRIVDLIHLDSYIFNEPIVPKKFITTNTARRNVRLIRRQIERQAARRHKLGYLAQSLGVMPEDLAKIPANKIHELRSRAISERVELPEFIKVLFHLIQNRGYFGDPAQEEVIEKPTDKKSRGKVETKLRATEKLLDKQHAPTLGALLYQTKLAAATGNKFTTPWRKLNEGGTFITRELVQKEFELLWTQQAKHHPALNGVYKVTYGEMFPDFPDTSEISLKQAFGSALFYQRPIRWELDSVGLCSLEDNEYRAACAQPAYQEYRILDNLQNLRIFNRELKQERSLTPDEISQLFLFLNSGFEEYDSTGVVVFFQLYKQLHLQPHEKFTIDRGSARGLKGNCTSATFFQIGQLNTWSNLSDKEQELVMEFLANITKYADIEANPEGSIRKQFEKLTKNITNQSASDAETALNFILLLKKEHAFTQKLGFDKNRSDYSVKALRQLTPLMLQGHDKTELIDELYPIAPEGEEGKRCKLRALSQVTTNSPVIDRVLRELQRVLTYITHKKVNGVALGNPAEIVIELSRDLRKTLAQREFLERQNAEAARERSKAMKELQAMHFTPTARNIEKYLLWQEQDKHCPYSGQSISQSQAFDELSTQVDHILPQASGGPNVFSNKVLVMTPYNLAKGNNTPWLSSLDSCENKVNWDVVEKYAAGLQKKAKSIKKQPVGSKYLSPIKKRNLEEKAENLLTKKSLEELSDGFSNRQNQQTAWIAKIVLDWCTDICPKVSPSFGALTAHLRKTWHTDKLLPQIRLSENKKLYNKDNKEIDAQIWRELFSHDIQLPHITATRADFDKYLAQLPQPACTQSDKEAAWKNFRRSMRPYHQFYKRCDHRHHAIDAAIVGLCDLSMVQKASRHNARYGTLNTIKSKDGRTKIEGFFPEHPFKELNDTLQNRLTNYVVWHKPDHFPNGQFFDDSAYKLVPKNGKQIFSRRYTLSKLIEKKPTAQDFIADLELRLVGEEIKQAIISQLKTRLDKGFSLEKALLGESETDGIIFKGNKVKKVTALYKSSGLRSFRENIDKAIIMPNAENKPRNKYLVNDKFACMDFDATTGKCKDTIPRWKYQQDAKNKPVPDGTIRIFAGDILFDKKTKEFVKVKSFNTEKGLMTATTTETNEKQGSTRHIKNMILIKDRQTLAAVKKEYGK